MVLAKKLVKLSDFGTVLVRFQALREAEPPEGKDFVAFHATSSTSAADLFSRRFRE